MLKIKKSSGGLIPPKDYPLIQLLPELAVNIFIGSLVGRA